MVSAFELRIALVIVAAIIIAAIYVWYRTNSKGSQIDELSSNDFDLSEELDDIPPLADVDEAIGLPDDLRSEFQDVSKELRDETISKRVQEAKQVREQAAGVSSVSKTAMDKSSKEMLVIFHVVAHEAEMFTGPMIVRMMSELELEHGEMGIYHYNIERLDKKHSVYCIANMLKPGVFDLENMDTFETRGLTMILQLPGPEEELKSFNIMVEHAQRLAAFLNGDLLDENHNPISKQSISLYKEQVQLFGLRATRQSATA
ncbi:MAG: cell division protein ZipA C-terminal FtsZ-binding domain-containing protein [Gammaproteobacteria bacterium]|nr:cell division protein ZipA C-terminal FtsZ-binding domain-containing protein [Gammaproteobacteria bacterium]